MQHSNTQKNKLLLVEDVDDLGRSGDVVTVKRGYARNFLLPQGYAVMANAHALRMQTRLQEERKKKAAVDKQEADAIASQVEGVLLTTIVKVDQEGHMYGSVSTLDIVNLLQKELNVAIEKRMVQLKHALKETGVHSIALRLKESVPASFKLKVISEEGLAAERAEEEAAKKKAAKKESENAAATEEESTSAEKKAPRKRTKKEKAEE